LMQQTKSIRLLYAEDNAEAREETLEVLHMFFDDICVAHNGAIALEHYRDKRFDLIITDINMPVLNGLDLIARIRETDRTTPILIVSVHNEREYLKRGIGLGISGYILKPMELVTFLETIESSVEKITSMKKHELEREDLEEKVSLQEQQLKMEAEAREVERQQLTLLQNMMDQQQNLIIVTDGRQIIQANQAFLDFFDVDILKEFLQKHSCICYYFLEKNGYFYVDNMQNKEEIWIDSFMQENEESRLVCMHEQKSCKERVFTVQVNHLESMSDFFIATFTDITNIHKKSQENYFNATHDILTGIYNRAYFNDELPKMISLAKRYTAPLSLILFDIDHFKQINDMYGHLTGDEVLIHLVSIIRHTQRESDLFVRWGGEEFVIALPNTDQEQACSMAESIRKRVISNVPKPLDALTVSFGVTSFRSDDDERELFRRADEALYRAKSEGRDRVVCQ
ncbi:MAG: diguanylate cyclase, partial [Campylobacterota bacterium]|nr:diguanylate cyclase [Campylobacterota bacterium]